MSKKWRCVSLPVVAQTEKAISAAYREVQKHPIIILLSRNPHASMDVKKCAAFDASSDYAKRVLARYPDRLVGVYTNTPNVLDNLTEDLMELARDLR